MSLASRTVTSLRNCARSLRNGQYLFAACAGLLLAGSFPNWNVAGLAWLAPGLVLLAGLGSSGRVSFRVGYVAGLTYYLASLYWLLLIPVAFLPILGWIALCSYLALFTGCWAWICLLWVRRPNAPPTDPEAWFGNTLSLVKQLSWTERARLSVSAAILWVALEMIIARLFSGFPWDLLGVSQSRMLPLIQISSVTGVYGVSFLIVWFSVSLMFCGLTLVTRPLPRWAWLGDLLLPGFAIAAVLWFGLARIRNLEAPTRTLKVALVQPSIPQTLIWDPKENNNRFQQLIRLSEEALETSPKLLIWPEASVPNMLRHDETTARAVQELVRKHNVWLILGADDAEARPDARDFRDVDYFNSSFAISPEGTIRGNYRKRRLVIFGEYVPFVTWLPFLKVLSPAGDGGFTPGKRPVPFRLDDVGVNTSVLICFEDVFPHLAREYVQGDTDFLLNLTNNGWFGESAAQWQHAASAVFRAVENNIPLVRCANNGLTCWVDSVGRMHEVFFPGSNDVYRAGFKTANVPLLPPGTQRSLSFYTRYGDVFGWSCVAATALHILTTARSRRSSRQTIAPRHA